MPTLSDKIKRIRQIESLANLGNITRGIEKESLRVTADGTLAQTRHPQAMGSALTHPRITTDYSEALLEFITPPSDSIGDVLNTLDQIHRFSYQHMNDELLWVNSMPCVLGDDSRIPIGKYGSSNSGRMKSIYRLGLGHRYGRAMQTIAGIHFNFSISDQFWEYLRNDQKSHLSLKDFKTEGYFRLIRNFRRNFWLLLYLFGAAPAVCKSFLKNRQHQLIALNKDNHTLHSPLATSLRMGDLGYQSSAQESLIITYNCLDSYTETLCKAITQAHPDYESIGVFDNNGKYKQLNSSLLQIENEFYSVIRPKRTSTSGQTALNALTTGGVEYIEVRCLDLDPFKPVGIDEQQVQFLDLFLLLCLLEDSPFSNEAEHKQIQENQKRMVYQGRKADLKLFDQGKERSAREWGLEIFEKLELLAETLDPESKNYQIAIKKEKQKLEDDRLTPSYQILENLRERGLTFYRFAMDASQKNKAFFTASPLSKNELDFYENLAADSLKKQSEIENNQSISFQDFLNQYYDQYDCCSTPIKSKKIAEPIFAK
jgi:glutamate--cysteine ligase